MRPPPESSRAYVPGDMRALVSSRSPSLVSSSLVSSTLVLGLALGAAALPLVACRSAATGGTASRAASGAPRASGPDAPEPAPIAWVTKLDREHPLVGRIWSVEAARFVDEKELAPRLHGYLLLGEKHDNPDHHALQARLLRAMIDARRRPVVAFEMFDADDQTAIERSRRAHPRDAANLARAVDWAKSGWPPWEDYAPIAQLALDHDLAIVATGLPRSRMRALVKPSAAGAGAAGAGDAGAADAGPSQALDEGTPLAPAQEASLREELLASHCGHLPESRVAGMMRFQRARDAAMANALIAAVNDARTEDGVLIAGAGHTRRDRGAGRDLLARDARRPVQSIAFAEVEASKNEPAAYAERWNAKVLPFDFVWFTPRATDDDPCAAFAH